MRTYFQGDRKKAQHIEQYTSYSSKSNILIQLCIDEWFVVFFVGGSWLFSECTIWSFYFVTIEVFHGNEA